MELSESRLDEIMEICKDKTEDEMLDWVNLQPDKDLINEFLDNAYAVFSSNPSAPSLPKLNP